MIGDPKQAIYSFRGADVYAYLEARNEMERLAAEGRAGLYSLAVKFAQAVNVLVRGFQLAWPRWSRSSSGSSS